MADKKLNEVQKVTDMAYVPVILADGSVGQIAKADLASVVAGLITSSQISSRLGYTEYSGSISSLVMNGYYVSQNDNAHKKAVGGLLIVEYAIAGSEWQNSRQGRLVFYSAGWKDIRVSEEGAGMSYDVVFDSSNYNSFTITLTPSLGTLVYLRYKSAFNLKIN